MLVVDVYARAKAFDLLPNSPHYPKHRIPSARQTKNDVTSMTGGDMFREPKEVDVDLSAWMVHCKLSTRASHRALAASSSLGLGTLRTELQQMN